MNNAQRRAAREVKLSGSGAVSRGGHAGKHKLKNKCDIRYGYWFGLLNRVVREDREARGEPPELTTEQVLAWADAFLERTGEWPNDQSGEIPEAPGETWLLVAAALALGLRGFPRGGSIARFLHEHRGRYNRRDPRFTLKVILAWIDEWYARTGDYPYVSSGLIPGAGGVNWVVVDHALRLGRGMLPGGSSLLELLGSERGVIRRSPLCEEQILAWADGFRARTGTWPHSGSGPIPEMPGETWSAVDSALVRGHRGLPGGLTVTRLLIEQRGIRSQGYLPPLTIIQILTWADAYHDRNGTWPEITAGPLDEAPGESWSGIDASLSNGNRGLPGGSSLARLLARERGKRYAKDSRTITAAEILGWADAYKERHGKWPEWNSGPIPEAPGENWQIINNSLRFGRRGLPEGSSIARLLAEHRCRPHPHDLARYTIPQILAWADAFLERTGDWPKADSGEIPGAPGETWRAVGSALQLGRRGLPGGSSLARLLAEQRDRRHSKELPPYTIPQMLAWADDYHARKGEWPTMRSGAILESGGETWRAVDSALKLGRRGLPGGSSLARLLAERRGRRHERELSALTIGEILTWADAFRARTGEWPRRESGPIPESRGDHWYAIDYALKKGTRGLRGNSSIARLLSEHRGLRNTNDLPALAVLQILAWADAYRGRTGRWPGAESGAIPESPGEAWHTVSYALKRGARGLPGGSSLAGLLAERRGQEYAGSHPDLTFAQILGWADAFRARTGRWPHQASGAVPESPGETWSRIHYAIKKGQRGLAGDYPSLANLLDRERRRSAPP